MLTDKHLCVAAACALSVLVAGCVQSVRRVSALTIAQPELVSRSVPIIEVNGYRFRDLDRDGQLTPYEDWRLSPQTRAADLVSRMTLAEKAAAMLHPVMRGTEQVTTRNINSVLTRSSKAPAGLAEENNAFQEAAEHTRLAIPITVSSDPRNEFKGAFGISVATTGFSKWPDPTGFAAIGDAAAVRRFAEIVAQEYRAVGINMALSPQADVATEPRWSRVSGTFGEDFATVGKFAAAYVEGIQGSPKGLTSRGVAAIVKHFAGYGAAEDGWDSHSRYGRFATYPGGRFADHVAAFRPSLRANVAGVMPTYSILKLPGHPQVGGAFNKVLLTDILRKQEGFAGLVLSDWSVTEDCRGLCVGEPLDQDRSALMGKPWGVENLSRAQRIVMGIEAGTDQFGYDSGKTGEESSPIVEAVQSGRISAARIDESVRRIMVIKFQLGLFENPFVDVARTAQVVGQAAFAAAALDAQQRSLVLLENKDKLLPLNAAGRRVYLRGVGREAAQRAGFTVVDSPDQAQLAIVRIVTPWQTRHPDYLFGRMQHEGDLDFKPDNADLIALKALAARLPTIVTVYLERPAILTEVKNAATALIGNFGVSDEALLTLITGGVQPIAKLPFELPVSMAAAANQKSDVPHDSVQPLYPLGYGLTF